MSGALIAILFLIGGIILLIFSSDIAVKHSAILASALGVSPLIIGVTLVSIGTDLSEIVNSIVSCALGHGDIDVGDSIGSGLTQLTLVFGLLPLICGAFMVERKQIIVLGACEILALIVVLIIVSKGFITRLDAIFMVGSLVFYFLLIIKVMPKDVLLERVDLMKIDEDAKSKKFHATVAFTCFIGVAISAFVIVNSVIMLSSELGIHEYIISFAIVSIGTSLPELSVDINALRRGEESLAIGDVIGSCIVDATLSIGIGQVLFPQAVSAELAIPTILYTIFASIVVFSIVAARGKVDKKAGVLFISLYLGSFILLFFLIIG